MKQPFFHSVYLFLFLALCQIELLAQDSQKYAIIPQPQSLTPEKGEFLLNEKTTLLLPVDSAGFKLAASFLADLVKNAAGYELKYGKAGAKPSKNTVAFLVDPNLENEEAYTLQVHSKGVQIKSKTAKGAFFAVQTLRQLMPAEVEGKSTQKTFPIPAVTITDAPRFSYRGVMLDVGRYYFPVDFLRKYIDLLAFYKINTFHLHLTEDAGWRMEIKKYPKLQEIAAWRDSTVVGHAKDKPRKYDGKRHGGYYTQQELKELVKYAQNRFITIIPEIDMPGHSLAALAAYPELGCLKDTTYQVLTAWAIQKDIFCPHETTFTFLEDVLTEVMEVFPSKYIHIGGDEAPKDRWKQSAAAQEVIKREGLKDEHELQSYFIRRVEKFVNSKGRAIIGWDEILEGGLAPNATVMSWRGEKGGIAAAKQKHDVIMTPNTYLYLDYYQTPEARKTEPVAIGGYLPLEKVYSYNPVPASLTAAEAKHILGTQANVWTEYISTGDHAEHMTFPRASAFAEVAWTRPERKNYADFKLRLLQHSKHLDKLKVKYAPYFKAEKGLSQAGK
ncbi:beta-N-acetylglucosaminidase [Rufibacter immobilis]|uniref:beta-N-acetylhexosaminidase n=1 Tax=Rufibacter immobilis TaxID=1348778 RepID=A0A3M9N730_9BACT|nr:beta-N-acetylhexosaminidase [Rufibacter immobilis]RNI33023.1 beta-N-acetylglucosaminidase [Rufibacter immobilis]